MQVKVTSGGNQEICFAHALTRQEESTSFTMGFSVLTGPFSFQEKMREINMKRTNDFSREERNMLRAIIEEKTGYCFRKNSRVQIQAFTRSSYTAMCGGENNEVLEFIGDQVMSYYLTKQIAERCGALNHNMEFSFRIRENRFTAIKQELVCNENLEQIIDQWGIAEYLIVGKTETVLAPKAKADLFEAILGAIALESSWNPEVLEAAVEKMLDLDNRLAEMIATDFRPMGFDLDTAITVLKELAEQGGCTMPTYECWELGHNQNGDPQWGVKCSVNDSRTGVMRSVRASSKKDAKKAAAYLVLCDHFEVQNQYGPNDFSLLWIYHNGRLVPDNFEK